eukprot:s9748_g2.t1
MIMSVFANASTCEQFVCCLCPDTSLVSGPCWRTFEWPENASEAKGGRSFESLRSAVALAQFVLIILLIDVMLYRQSKQMRVADFLANDLSEEPWRTKAEKNAFELVRQRRFELACAFFVFSQRARDAIDADGSASDGFSWHRRASRTVRTLELLHSMDPESLRRCAADGRTPAHWAALSGQVAALGTLASLVPDTLAAHARNGATPAHDAAFQGQSHVLLHLHQINPNSLMAKSETGATPAHDAAFSGHIETMLLLRELAPESLSARDLHGRCAAHEAAETGQDSLLRLLYLLVPATLHARDGAGWLPEDVAEAHGWESTARLLKSLPPVQCHDSADDASDDVEQVCLEEDAPPEPEPTREDPAPSEPKAPEAEPEHPQEPANEETSAQAGGRVAPAAEPPEKEPTRSAQVSDESVLEEGKSMEPVTPDPLASDLCSADWSWSSSGGSDAYCLVEIPGSNKGFQTEVVENSSDPVWNKSGKLVLAPEEVLLFKVMDRDDGDADDLLGKVPVDQMLMLQ